MPAVDRLSAAGLSNFGNINFSRSQLGCRAYDVGSNTEHQLPAVACFFKCFESRVKGFHAVVVFCAMQKWLSQLVLGAQ